MPFQVPFLLLDFARGIQMGHLEHFGVVGNDFEAWSDCGIVELACLRYLRIDVLLPFLDPVYFELRVVLQQAVYLLDISDRTLAESAP